MNNKINIKNALISVFDKEGLEDVVYKLNASGVNIYSTGGTENFIKNLQSNFQILQIDSNLDNLVLYKCI